MSAPSRRPLVALATSADWPELAPDDRALAPALARAGVDAEIAIWTDAAVAWERFDLVLVRSCWDYHHDLPRWLGWVDTVGAVGHRAGAPRLHNSPAVLRWNARKTYLADLAARGIPTVPTVWIESPALGSWNALGAAARAAPWDDLVLKPAISAGALGTVHVARAALAASEATLGALLPELARRAPLLVQPYLPEIATDGEWSLLFFDGRLSHAVVKRPAAGDFRVQEKHGGSTVAASPPLDVVRAAERTLAVAAAAVSDAIAGGDAYPRRRVPTDRPWLYARVDLVVSAGVPLLVELEAIEPALFLATTNKGAIGPSAAETLAAAIADRITSIDLEDDDADSADSA